MRTSDGRILTTHAGSLPRPRELAALPLITMADGTVQSAFGDLPPGYWTSVAPAAAGPEAASAREVLGGLACSTTALNVGDRPIPAGEEVRIEAVDGLTLRVRVN